MIKLYVLILSMLTGVIMADEFIPKLKETAQTSLGLVPANWKMISSVMGDLNKDGLEDLVFVIQNTNLEKIQIDKEFIGNSTDLNPRVLAIYFWNPKLNRFEKQMQKNNLIPLKDAPNIVDPFDSSDGIEVTKKGILKIRFRFFATMGSWATSGHLYKFRYQNNHFSLIGYDRYELRRNTGETIDYSIDFLSKRMSMSESNIERDKPKSVKWTNFELKKLKTLNSFDTFQEWEFMGLNL